jgi:hypothetical protein
MKRYAASLAVAALLSLGGWVLLAPASAAPPTVTPTPGYDARLQEQRAASTVYPSAPAPRPVHRRRARRVHDEAH